VFFIFGFEEFSLRNQISVLTILLLYIFGNLFGCGWFEVYNYFQLVSERVHSSLINFLSVILDSFMSLPLNYVPSFDGSNYGY